MQRQYIKDIKLSSFDKSFSTDTILSEPDKYKILEEVSSKSEKIINMGSNLSYSPLGFSKDSLSMKIKHFNRVLEFDKNKKTITVEAGLTLIEFLNFTLQHKLWIPQLPGYPTITIGGAVAANSHGKSCAIHGTIRKSIKSILLFHKSHGWMNLSKDENEEIFDLTIGGLGLTGSIVSVTFNLINIENSKFDTKISRVNSIRDSKSAILDGSKDYSYIYTWNRADNLKNFGEGIVYKNYVAKNSNIFEKFKKAKNNFKPFFFCLWNKYSIKMANSIYLKVNQLSKPEQKEDFLSTIFPFYGKENYFNFFGKKGFIESQLLISEEKLDIFLDEFKFFFKEYEPTITLFSLKNMCGKHKFLSFEDNKICLTFDYVNNKRNLLFMSKIDDLYNKYDILPSIIKDSRISKKTFDQIYKGEAVEFKKQLYNFDKNRSYQSEISRRLEL